jgi:hypothetical protein
MLQYFRFLPILAALALCASSASACAVCFGNSGDGSSWNLGFTWGVAFLVMLPFIMMAGFVGWIAYAIRKRSRQPASLTAN